MASQLPQESMRASTLKPLNPRARSFSPPTRKICQPQLGLPWSPAFSQIPPSPMLLRPMYTYQPHTFGFCSPNMCRLEVAASFLECRKEEHLGGRMAGNTQRPPRSRCMGQKRNLPAINARRDHEHRWKTGNKVLRDGHPIIPFPTTMEECNRSTTTTVMIKNVPYHLQCKDLLMILDKHCAQQNQSTQPASSSMYDFVYLPMDYRKFIREKRQSNLGYAFVNFTLARAAFRFYQEFNGQKWTVNEKWKVCEVTKAQIQGREALMRKFKEKVFRCGNPSFRPVEFKPPRDGANHGVEEIRVGKFEEGLPEASKSKPRTLPRQ